jgi:phosphoribosylanthranilate isomerase
LIPIIKICGLKTLEAVKATTGVDYIGFIFFPRSPRNITPEQAAVLKIHSRAKSVAVTVDASDEQLRSIMQTSQPDYLQLHGSETPARVAEIKKVFSVPVIKALPIKIAEDIQAASAFEDVADILMFDAKSFGDLPGGNGISFDWKMLAGRKFKKPYFLSGGLNISNVEQALKESGATMIDVSSGLESSPGNKDPRMIAEFIRSVKSLSL